MRDQFVGDIGDFGKFGLLRALTGYPKEPEDRQLGLGIVWYYTKHDGTGGKITDYLRKDHRDGKKLRKCDRWLYDKLRRITIGANEKRRKDRNITEFQQSEILAKGTKYYSHKVYGNDSGSRQSNPEGWLTGALDKTKEAQLVFLDPDNRITTVAEPDPKYVSLIEIGAFLNNSKPPPSLVIYHHLPQGIKRIDQLNLWGEYLKRNLELSQPPWALLYRRGTSRAFFIIPQERHAYLLWKRVDRFLRGPFGTTRINGTKSFKKIYFPEAPPCPPPPFG